MCFLWYMYLIYYFCKVVLLELDFGMVYSYVITLLSKYRQIVSLHI